MAESELAVYSVRWLVMFPKVPMARSHYYIEGALYKQMITSKLKNDNRTNTTANFYPDDGSSVFLCYVGNPYQIITLLSNSKYHVYVLKRLVWGLRIVLGWLKVNSNNTAGFFCPFTGTLGITPTYPKMTEVRKHILYIRTIPSTPFSPYNPLCLLIG
jgi:hypothetical protein